MRHKIRRNPVEKPTGAHALTSLLSSFSLRIRRADKWVFAILAVAAATRAALTLMRIQGEYPTIPGLSVNYWNDFYGYYVSWLRQVSSGVTPYKGCACGYTPLFLYTLLPFYLLGGAHAASIPITASDALTSIVIYKTVRKLGSRNAALVAGFGYALSPFALIYEGYMWMSSQPMTLFLALAVLSIESDRPLSAAAFLAISVMFKQEALLTIPVFMPIYYLRFRQHLLKGAAVFSGILLGVSLPFLILAPQAYITQLSYGVVALTAPPSQTQVGGGIASLGTGATTAATTILSQYLYRCTNTFMNGALGPLTLAQCGPTPQNYYEVFYKLIYLRIDAFLVYTGYALILALIPIVAYSIRRGLPSGILLAYSLMAMLTLFSLMVHGLYRYYYLPAYAASMAASKTLKTSTILVAIEFFAVMITNGALQAALALLPIIYIILTLNR